MEVARDTRLDFILRRLTCKTSIDNLTTEIETEHNRENMGENFVQILFRIEVRFAIRRGPEIFQEQGLL